MNPADYTITILMLLGITTLIAVGFGSLIISEIREVFFGKARRKKQLEQRAQRFFRHNKRRDN